MIKKRIILRYLILLWVILLTGCGGKTALLPVVPAESTPVNKVGALGDYFLQPGDNLDIRFYKNPELNENVTIRPDGRISLEPIGDITAAGLTPVQLDKALTEKYSMEIKNSIITVILQTFGGQKIYVGGEVNTPMIVEVMGKINALEAIISAGGALAEAKLSSVVIVSKGKDNQPLTRIVDLKKARMGQLPESEYLLKPFDMVYVPKTKLSGASQFVQQIYSFIPNQIGLNFSYQLHREYDDNDR
jgi:protein involved in polysaccharide export with SLBB domain